MKKQEKFNKLFNENIGSLVYYSRKLTKGRKEDAEDLLQDTMIKAFRKIDSYSSEKGKFSTWASRIMYNLFIDNKRREDSRIRTVEYEDMFSDEGGLLDVVCDDSFKRMVDKMHIREIMDYMDVMSEKNRELYKLYIDGYSLQEISDITKLPMGSVKFRIYTSRKKFGEYIKKIS